MKNAAIILAIIFAIPVYAQKQTGAGQPPSGNLQGAPSGSGLDTGVGRQRTPIGPAVGQCKLYERREAEGIQRTCPMITADDFRRSYQSCFDAAKNRACDQQTQNIRQQLLVLQQKYQEALAAGPEDFGGPSGPRLIAFQTKADEILSAAETFAQSKDCGGPVYLNGVLSVLSLISPQASFAGAIGNSTFTRVRGLIQAFRGHNLELVNKMSLCTLNAQMRDLRNKACQMIAVDKQSSDIAAIEQQMEQKFQEGTRTKAFSTLEKAQSARTDLQAITSSPNLNVTQVNQAIEKFADIKNSLNCDFFKPENLNRSLEGIRPENSVAQGEQIGEGADSIARPAQDASEEDFSLAPVSVSYCEELDDVLASLNQIKGFGRSSQQVSNASAITQAKQVFGIFLAAPHNDLGSLIGDRLPLFSHSDNTPFKGEDFRQVKKGLASFWVKQNGRPELRMTPMNQSEIGGKAKEILETLATTRGVNESQSLCQSLSCLWAAGDAGPIEASRKHPTQQPSAADQIHQWSPLASISSGDWTRLMTTWQPDSADFLRNRAQSSLNQLNRCSKYPAIKCEMNCDPMSAYESMKAENRRNHGGSPGSTGGSRTDR